VDFRSRAYAIERVDDGVARDLRFELGAGGSPPPAGPF
jgi:hypothetical protein